MNDKKQKDCHLIVFYNKGKDNAKENATNEKQLEKLIGSSVSMGYHHPSKEKNMLFSFDTIAGTKKAKNKVEKLGLVKRIETY